MDDDVHMVSGLKPDSRMPTILSLINSKYNLDLREIS